MTGLERHLYGMTVVVHGKDDVDINDVVQKCSHLAEAFLGRDPKGLGDFNMATGEMDLHRSLLMWGGARKNNWDTQSDGRDIPATR